VSSAVLSLLNPVILPPAGEAVVLKLTGLMDASGLVPGVASAPCSLRFRDLGIRGGAAAADGGGASIGEGVTNVVTVRRESLIPDTRGLDVLLLLDVPPQVTLRVDVAGPLAAAGPRRRLDADRSIVPWEVASTTGEATLPVEAGVTLESRLEPCVSDPPACVGENFQEVRQDGTVIYGCLDGVDNDGDGRTDLTDLSCVAAQGWSLVLAVEPCFGLVSATTRGTVADTRPPGWRDPSGSFEKTDVVPIRGAAGVVAVVSAVVLSFQKPIFLPQVSDSTVLLLTGEMAVPAAPGESGDACRLEFLHYLGESLAAIAGDGQGADEPIPTLVAVGGSSVSPHLTDAELRVANRAAEFLRGDTNGDSKADMSDPITILGHLFLGGRIRNCRDAADVDDSGFINIADAVFELSFLFLSGASPPPPGSRSCGDPTADPLGCDENETACAP
jgi:hypothetical protein